MRIPTYCSLLSCLLSLSMQTMERPTPLVLYQPSRINMQWIKDNLKEAYTTQAKFYRLDKILYNKLEMQKIDIQFTQTLEDFSSFQEKSLEITNILSSLEQMVDEYFFQINALAIAIQFTFDIKCNPPVRPLFYPRVTYSPLTKLDTLLQQIHKIIEQPHQNIKTLFIEIFPKLDYQLHIAKFTTRNNLNILFKQQSDIREIVDSTIVDLLGAHRLTAL